MKASTLVTAGKAIILVCFTLFVVLPLLMGFFWKVSDLGYTRFCLRSQAYYARVADACDTLLASAEPIPRELKHENLKSLPAVLRNLNIDHVVVNTNSVMMVVGSGLMAHQILWRPTTDGSSWILITGTPETGKSRVIYTRARPTCANHRA
jgi:hypothetical protein